MNKELRHKELILRQLSDIIAKAEALEKNTDFDNEIENFSNYSEELKQFIIDNINDLQILDRVKAIPKINYKKLEYKFWNFLIFPIELIMLYKRYYLKKKCLQQISHTKSLYSSIQYLIKMS